MPRMPGGFSKPAAKKGPKGPMPGGMGGGVGLGGKGSASKAMGLSDKTKKGVTSIRNATSPRIKRKTGETSTPKIKPKRGKSPNPKGREEDSIEMETPDVTSHNDILSEGSGGGMFDALGDMAAAGAMTGGPVSISLCKLSFHPSPHQTCSCQEVSYQVLLSILI